MSQQIGVAALLDQPGSRSLVMTGNQSCLPPVPLDDEARLAALASYQLEYGTTPPALQQIAAFAADVFQAPIALVSLVARDRQYFKGQVGLDASGTSRDVSFCAHAIMGPDVFVVPDATRDPRFSSNPLVTGEPGIRFYAGAPLISPQGHGLGSLCIIDRVPRPPLTDRERRLLTSLAELVMERMEQQRLDIERRATLARFTSMAAATPSAVVCADADRRIVFWNAAAEQLLGWSAAEALGQELELIVPKRMRAAHAPNFVRFLATCDVDTYRGRTIELPVLCRNETEVPAEVTLSAWREDGQPVFGAAIRDISLRQRAQADLLHLAHHDALTGLLNRARFTDLAAKTLKNEAPAGLVLLDLDGFKHINDTLGHGAGDTLLREIASRLTACLGHRGHLARLGGDEFAVLLPGTADFVAANALAEELQQVLSAAPFTIGFRRFSIGATAGVAVAPAQGHDLDTLLSNADLALYQGKATRPGSCQVFAPSLRSDYDTRRALEAEVQRAAERGEFVLHYQPQIRLADGVLVGAEALMRWRHPGRGLLTPGSFLSALEAGPRAGAVGDWAIDEVCRQAAIWRQAGKPLKLGVNLFSEQLRTGNLEDTVMAGLQRWKLPGEAIELELTETIALSHDDATLRPLHALRKQGIGIAFDDFGTGFASLATLKRFPLTRLKIDRSFVSDLDTDPHDRAIVEAVLALGRGLELNIVAEGIETAEQEIFLAKRACDEGQGYRYSRPCSPKEFSALFSIENY
ncbi:MAG: EAL domain-containing protein [Pseudomonas sp.]|uniref:putative bifunctional diguanylate cyclase/phosphodiesterase n=1 Tax=Pseudomonas sp. TaxID=306 RepID=UPI001228BC21|nr:EAL domain-containing protein [Pseudomonas sp.]RZI72370.1 MAG: EAL domain-containing protein [Pseudomonas sp.]